MRSIATTPLLAVLGCVATFAGCTVGPDYTEPDLTAPEAWQAADAADAADDTDAIQPEQPAELAAWWRQFGDSTLDELMDLAVSGNLRLAQALARIEESRALLGVARGGFFPRLDAIGSFRHSRSSAELSDSRFARATESNQWRAGFDASWELDVFGRVRRSSQAARADFQASREDLRDISVALLAEVAQTYVEARSLQQRVGIAQANAASQRETLELVQARFDAGAVPRLDVAQAERNLYSTEATIPDLQAGLQRAKNRLSVLVGGAPGTVSRWLDEPMPVPEVTQPVGVGLPADLLRQRPDLRQAARQLEAQTARIGVAVADLFPQFSLTGTFTLDAAKFADVFQSSARAYGLGPSVRWLIFDGNRVRSRIAAEKARTAAALAGYQNAFLRALEEVENAITDVKRQRERRRRLTQAEAATREAVEQARTLYREGARDFQSVLDAEQGLLNIQDQLALSEAAVTAAYIRLYQALGGGWQDPPTATFLAESEPAESD